MTLAPGTRLAQYEVVSVLGKGGMGVVYRARDARLGREVALKTIVNVADLDARERFVREVRAAARVRHQGVVGVHDAQQVDGQLLVAFELVEGETLAARVKRAPLAPNDAARVGLALAEALVAVHAEGIVHRDLKPANVLLDREERPRITDFGLARDAKDVGLTATGDVLGTPHYMAPEQALGDNARVGPRTDLWALGAIVHESLAGKPPFSGASPMQILRSVLEDDPEPPSVARAARGLGRVPLDLETIVAKLLEKDPARRYASAQDLAADLRRFLSGEAIAARPPSPRERTRRWIGKHRTLVGALALVVVATGAVLANGVRVRARANDERVAALRSEIARHEAAAAPLARRWRVVNFGTHGAARETYRSGHALSRSLMRAVAAATTLASVDAAARADACAALERAARTALELDLYTVADAAIAPLEELNAAGAKSLRSALEEGLACEADVAELDGAHYEARATGALPLARRLVAQHPRSLRIQLRAIQVFEEAGALDDADAALARARALSSTSAAVPALEYRVRFVRRDFEGAIAAATRWLEALETSEGHVARAFAALELGRLDDALRDAARALALEPVDDRALGLRGEAEYRLGRRDAALATVDAALRERPHDRGALATRARIHLDLSRFPEAIADYERLVEMDPLDAFSWHALGVARAGASDLDGAAQAFTRAIAIDGQPFVPWRDRGMLLARMGATAAALADLRAALERCPRDHPARKEIVDAIEKLEKR